jgi:hypothetical protein
MSGLMPRVSLDRAVLAVRTDMPPCSYKKRTIQHAKTDGKERVEYWIVTVDGKIKTCATRTWHEVNLPDITSPEMKERCAELRYSATRVQVNQIIEDNAWLRAQNFTNSHRYQRLCEHISIFF